MEQQEQPSILNDNTEKIIRTRYLVAMQQVKEIMAGATARNISRATLAAIELGLDSGFPTKITSEKEANLGGLLAQIIDMKIILMGIKQKQQKTGEENGNNTES